MFFEFSFVNEVLLAIFLGIVQGLTEFLPVSSTAHLFAINIFITKKDIGLTTSNAIQLGTIFALIQVFWLDLKIYWKRLISLFNKVKRENFIYNLRLFLVFSNLKSDSNLKASKFDFEDKISMLDRKNLETDWDIIKIFIATIPIVVLGFFLKEFVDNERIRNFFNLAIFLVLGSAIMYLAEKKYQKNFHSDIINTNNQDTFQQSSMLEEKNENGEFNNLKNKNFWNNWSIGESFFVGLFQSLAIFPGMSRSGSTISGSLFVGHDRKQSVKFAFLLSIPTILLAGIVDLIDIIYTNIHSKNIIWLPTISNWQGDNINLSILSILIAILVAYIIGFVSLKWLLKYLSKNTFIPFIIYRLILAVILITFFFIYG